MLVPHKKDQYAFQAIYELARRYGEGPTKDVTIATRQAIPIRFLEVILNQLKYCGIVQSKRGFQGGYYFLCRPQDIAVGDVMHFMEPKRVTMNFLK
jgi:Rrf2 family protein